jgi:hypothetical protein
MTVNDLYRFAIDKATELDPRGSQELARSLERVRVEYDALDEKAKQLFDKERLTNPFGDTRIVGGDPDATVERLVCGVNIYGAEVLLADALGRHGKPVDLVVEHHPSGGGALGSRFDTLWPQVKMLTDVGVPAHRAEKLIRKTADEPQRSTDYQVNQIATALGIPMMSIHSPADIFLYAEGHRILREDRPETVGDLMDICDSWPEVQWMMDRGRATQVAVGDRRDPLGKVYAVFYGGRNPTPEVFEAICDADCGTLWVVDTSDDLNEVARRRHVSIVVVPHFPADNLGLNLLFDAAMERFGEFDVVDCGNYVRVDRRGNQK